MLGKIGSAFITGVHGLGAIVLFLAAAIFTAWAAGGILEIAARRFFGFRWPESNWIIVSLTAFLVIYGLVFAAPALAETLFVATKGAFFGALASGAVAWFYRLHWQTVAFWGGIGFFLLCIFAAMLRQQPPAPSIPLPDIYGIGVDDPEKRMREEGYL